MFKKTLYKIFGTRNDRLLKIYYKNVLRINQLESSVKQLTDKQLKDKTSEFKDRYKQGESINKILIEAFAVCREASYRTLNMRHFDMQLVGGMVLHDGKIAEMRTGEGKTLAGTLSAYLNAIKGEGVHVVTVNDYLAKRDAQDMGVLYNFLGLTVGINLHNKTSEEKREAYACDITYGTNNEFGFDYLRDNMVYNIAEKVQRTLSFAIVDEVDSILIDEARTPLIISGPAEGSIEIYTKINKIPPLLQKQEKEDSKEGDFWVDEKNQNVFLSESGHIKVEKIMLDLGLLLEENTLYNPSNIILMHYLLSSMKAHYVFVKDQHYVVQDGEVMIVDEFTGRLMEGRRWSDGLHQAVEAKENVKINQENQTLASITFQNYFRMYKKLAGMTGTADTEAYEFQKIYNLETVVIPTHKKMIRIDHNDKIFLTQEEKYDAIIQDVKEKSIIGQPVLIGTTSVENSQLISLLLKKNNLKHEVLNAKQHSREAEIIAQAGSLGSITVATNMAGRGTDIVLGGNIKHQIEMINSDDKLSLEDKKNRIEKLLNTSKSNNEKVIQSGGLYIIGTERHESRRIDNQLRGRAGRQGDPGLSRFYLSMDDSLLRIFGSDKMRNMMKRLGMEKGESIEHKWLSHSIESAQRKVESHHFDIRKQLLEYDDVSNDQRKVVYQQRDEILVSTNLSNITLAMIEGLIGQLYDDYIPTNSVQEMWDIQGLEKILKDDFFLHTNLVEIFANDNKITPNEVKNNVIKLAVEKYKNKLHVYSEKVLSDVKMHISNLLLEGVNSSSLELIDKFYQNNSIPLTETYVNLIIKNPFITAEQVIDKVLNDCPILAQIQITNLERSILLQKIDYYWREHLTRLDQLKQGIHLRGYAQKDPKQEYKSESFNLFSLLLDNIKNDIAKTLLVMNINIDDNANKKIDQQSNEQQFIARNAPCPCKSGKKYKHCCGILK